MPDQRHLLDSMREQITTLVHDASTHRLAPGDFSRLIATLNELDQAQDAPGCPQCGLMPTPDLSIPALVRAVQTCRACPSQWDAWDASGQYYYLRFRSGHGTVETAADAKDYVDIATPNTTVASFTHGDRLDGLMDLEEFLAHAGIRWEPTA